MDSSETNSGQDSSASVLAAQPPMPICRLCQKPRVLRDSHFIPAAFYYHLNLDENGVFQNKALQKLTRSRFARVPGQVKKHLLCHDCEQRFSAHGESWIAKMAHQVGHGFRLQEALLQSPVEQARRFFYDTLVFDTPTLRHLVGSFGGSQLMLGTDYPFNFHDRTPVERVEAAGFDAETAAALIHRNAERFLGLSKGIA